MAKPEPVAGARSGVRYLCVSVVVTLLAVAAVITCVVVIDAQRRDQLKLMGDQLDTLRQLVDNLQRRLDLMNATVHAKKVPKEASQEVVYEDEEEYEYDDEGSYEYEEDDDKPILKGTVKRTPVLSERVNSSDATRTRRDIAAVREDSLLQSQEDRDKPLPKERDLQQKTPHQPTYQEQRRPEELHVRLRHGGRNRNGHVRDVEFMSQHSPEIFEGPQTSSEHKCEMLAAHYVGDASSYNIRDHSHYYGNNILYHPHGMFKDWIPADWMFDLGVNTHFPFHNGKLSIQKPGIYFVYAQIYYAATHDRCGFHIKRNGEEVAQCSVTSSGRMVKRNTCFTAVVLQLQTSDLLWTSEVEGHRNTSFKSSHSFFGLILLKPT